MTATIRFATRNDLADIRRLVFALADYERMTQHCTATEAYFEDILFGASPIAEALLADLPEVGAVGIALYTRTINTFRGRVGLFLEDLFVEPTYRGQRLGLALLRRLAEIAIERDHGVIQWNVLHWNEPSIRFYDQIGATTVTDWQARQIQGPALIALARGESTHG